MLSAPSKFKDTSEFLKFLIPALNGTVGFWSTVSLNIPDFTRFARDQREQAIGQAIALPTTMTLYSFIGVAVTSATVVIYGTAIWDPVQLLSRFHSPVAVVISLLAILLATLNVNIGANVVSPANDFSNLWPKQISFKIGGTITCFMGVAMMPWKLLANHRTFIFGWLGGYAAVLGPVAGIMICDYFVIRRRVLLVDDLYLRGSIYEYSSGFNWRAIAALLTGSGVALIGLVIPSLRALYDYSWFVGFAVAFLVYLALMRNIGIAMAPRHA
jgi:NCS1 family nucleobase:cation symporter-1